MVISSALADGAPKAAAKSTAPSEAAATDFLNMHSSHGGAAATDAMPCRC
jgi:hypothetical protein